MREAGLDALVVAPGANLYYLAGYWGRVTRRLSVLVLGAHGDDHQAFVCPGFEEGMHREGVKGVEDFRTWERTDRPELRAIEAIRGWGGASGRTGFRGKVAIDKDLPWHQALGFVQSARGMEFVSGADVMGEVRMVKTEYELERMREATEAAHRAIEKTTRELREGAIESDLEKLFKREADAPNERTDTWILMLFGPSSAEPHGLEQRRNLRKNDVALFDFGATRGGYHSDTTRTVFIGEPEDEAKRVWEIVRQAYRAARAAARPGVRYSEVDAAGRKIIEDAGYGANFTHGIGHGVGLEIHEPPYPEPRSDLILRAGAVVTIEPGVYLKGRFGIRLEDTVVVTEDGGLPIYPDPPMRMEL